MSYLNYAFVTWHLYFAKARNVKLSYPSISYEVRTTYNKIKNTTQYKTFNLLKKFQLS